jgi:8-oxo-dGTP pyrophosphatase MutT (NUDIX family)
MVGLATVQQSAALPFAIQEETLKLLLVTSIGTKRWIIPKGHLEPGLTASESAEFEALEEAGVVGNMISRSIGSYSYRKRPEKGGELCRVGVYALEVTRILETTRKLGSANAGGCPSARQSRRYRNRT